MVLKQMIKNCFQRCLPPLWTTFLCRIEQPSGTPPPGTLWFGRAQSI